MDSEGKLGLRIRRFFVPTPLLQSLADAPEAGAEGELLIGISKGVEQAADLVGALTSGADDAQGGGGLSVAGLDALEENTLELAAVLRAVGVNAAPAAIERGARLRPGWWAEGGAGKAEIRSEIKAGSDVRGMLVRGMETRS